MTVEDVLINKGIQKGIQKGIKVGVSNVARNLLSDGDLPERVARNTGLSMDDVLKIQSEMNQKEAS